MRVGRNIFLFIAVFLAAAFAWAGGKAEATVSNGPVSLVFRQSDPPDQIQGLLSAIDQYNKQQSRIHVTVENVPWNNALTQFIREAQAGGGPDVLQMAFVWTKDLATSETIDNLDPFIKKSPPGAGIDDFLGTDLGVYKGSIYGIPWTVDTNAMAYRPDLLKAAGIEKFPDTWDQLYQDAKKLTIRKNGTTQQYAFGLAAGSGPAGSMWFIVNYYLWSNGKTFVEKNADGKWQLGVTAKDVQNTMDYFNRFFQEGLTPKSLIGVDSTGDPAITGGLGRGDFAITFLTPYAFQAAQRQSKLPLETAMIPRGSVKRISHLGGRSLVINANTKHPEQSWEFLKFLLSKSVFQKYQQFPAQKSLLKELKFSQGEQGYADQLPYAVTFKQYIDSPAQVNSMWELTNREFGSVFSGQMTSAQASVDLVNHMQALLKQ